MHILRLLIRENLRSDTGAVGENYFDSLSKALLAAYAVHGDEPYSDVMQQITRDFRGHVRFLGAGSYRIAFSVKGDRVLKISLDSLGDVLPGESGNQMNRDDFELGNRVEFEGVFPRAYDHAPNFEWVVLERVKPIERPEEYLRFFRSQMLPNPESLDVRGQENYSHIIDAALKMGNHYFPDHKPLWSIGKLGPEWKEKHGDKTLGELREDLYKRSRPFRGLINAANEYKIDMNEFRPYNIGVAFDGRFVMLDSSIFPGRADT